MKMQPKDICPAVILMGVSGCGKSTFGFFLQREFGYEFKDGDDLHPPINVAKMSRGRALDDDDRAPWLEAICAQIKTNIEAQKPVVIACSALKRRYRDALRSATDHLKFIHLLASQDAISKRLCQREGHYMPPGLLPSQFAALESTAEEADVIDIDVEQHLLDIERQILDAVKVSPA